MGRAGSGGGGGGFSGGGKGSFGGGNRSGGGRSSFGGSGRSGGSFGGSGRSGGSFGGGGLFGGGRSGGSGSFSGGNRSGGGKSSFGSGSNNRSAPPGRTHTNYGGWFRPPSYNTIFVNNNRPSPPGGSNGRGGSGCLGCGTVLIAAVAILVIVAIVLALAGGGGSNVTPSTIARTPLPSGYVNETGYYTDELGWIKNETKLLTGLKNFYKATGVQPYVYITDNVNGHHIDDPALLEGYASTLYDELFSDEAHLLLIFYEYNGDYASYYLCGAQAKSVIDSEAGNILLDYIDKYYYAGDMSDEEFFSTSFDEAAKRIMTVEKSPVIYIIYAVLGLLAVVIVYKIVSDSAKRKLEKAKRDAEILNTPLEKFGDSDLKDLEKKDED